MKLLTIIGACPQFIKAATVSRAIREHNAATETVGAGWNQFTGAKEERILGAWHAAKVPCAKACEFNGEGQAAEQVVEYLARSGASG